jgi:SAM-dependent methyltransferase
MPAKQGHSFKAILDRGDDGSRHYVKAEIRGVAVAAFLARVLPPSKSVSVLDLGCGSGLISFALAAQYGSVFSVDQEVDNLEITSQGLARRGIRNVYPARATGFQLPFPDASFDGVVLNGVLEWVGVNDRGESPGTLQKRFLAEIHRVLRPEGVFYMAIENRSAPPHLWRDPHTNIPLVCLFPRSLAEWFSKTFLGRAYQVYIYTPWQLRVLLRGAGFDAVRLFSPVPGYQYPFQYVSLDGIPESLADIAAADFQAVTRNAAEVGIRLDPAGLKRKLELQAKWNLLAFATRDLAAVCRRA